MVRITNWQLYFRKEDGLANRFNAVSAFAYFWDTFSEPLLVVQEKFIIGGTLVGREDKADFYTPHIVCIERLKHEFKGDLAHDLMRAVTAYDDEFYFYSDDHTPEMRMMLGDMLTFHELNDAPGFYISRKHYNSLYI
ncbi:hypothetical protein IKF94_01195 [Candidatus Saccharibacteria bacterium]|nr:hypothetical protein [Candidatus Saccharibacteria bacterium]